MLEIILDHQRSEGSIKFRIRGIAYNYYAANKDKVTIEEVEKLYHLTDFNTFVKDREKYLKDKEERDSIKKQELLKIRQEKELAKQQKKEEAEKIKLEAEKIKLEKQREEAEKKERKQKEEAEKKEQKRKEAEQAKLLKQELLEKEQKQREEAEKIRYNYIYCLREREFIKTGELIYKVGKTTVNPSKRINQYPNESELILLIQVYNCHIFEKELLKVLDSKFKRAVSIGREYYEVKNIKDLITEIINMT